jgi:ribosomal protein L37E
MPNQPKTPIKCFRIPEATYQTAKRYAELQGTDLSKAVREFLETYIADAPELVTAHTCQHKAYRLTCSEFDALVASADGRCQRCGKRASLVIDHDHRFGYSAVRGLVCKACNSLMARVDAGEIEPDAKTARYMLEAHHLRRTAKGGKR